MVNFGLNSASVLGLLDIILAIAYFAVSIAIPVATGRELGGIGIFLYIIQAFIAPIVLLFVGFLFIFHGWRLDPILQFGCFLFHLLLIYLGVKDIILFKMLLRRNRR
ncbi:hypothetical protein [Allocoleopsis sp.]|uniref:hypothetical protein n=1 Tax=Allocoleopsis sp. TaxID=3088169 RepID=UPI002FD1B982